MNFEEMKSSENAFIAGYGGGGFRMGDQKIEGSLLITPKGYYPWDVKTAAEITVASLSQILNFHHSIELLIIGTGDNMTFISKDIRAVFAKQDIAIEAMDTGAAARTYNVLLQEGRMVSAAFIAVE